MSEPEMIEYGVREIFLAVKRTWPWLVALPLLAGAAAGYLAYQADAKRAAQFEVDVTISMRSLDRALTDFDLLFRKSLASAAHTLGGNDELATSMKINDVGQFDGGRGSLVHVEVDSPSGELASATLSSMIASVISVSQLRHQDVGEGSDLAAVDSKLGRLAEELSRLEAKDDGDDSATPGDRYLRAIAIASLTTATNALQADRNALFAALQPVVKVEVPQSSPLQLPAPSALRWIRMPILVAGGVGFFVLLCALLGDAYKRLTNVRRQT